MNNAIPGSNVSIPAPNLKGMEMDNGKFDIEAMLGLFVIGISLEKAVTLDWDEQQAIVQEIELFQKKQKKLEEIIRYVLEFIDAVKNGDNKKAYSKMFMVDICIKEYNLINSSPRKD